MAADGGGVFLPFGIKDEWSAPVKRMASVTKDFVAGLAKATQVTKEQTKETNQSTQATLKWNASLGKLAGEGLKKLNSFNARNLYRTFRDMPVLSLAVGEGLREGAKASMEFDRAMVDLQLSGTASADEIKEITSSTLRLAEATAFSRTEILEQATGLKKLGRSSAEAFNDVRNAAHFSELMKISLKEGVDAQTKVSQLYYGNISHMAEAGDLLAYSVKHLRIPMDDFLSAIERIGPAAALSKTPIGDTVGFLKGMTEAGIPAEKSAVSLARVMSQAAKVGLTFNDALDQIRKNYQRYRAERGEMAGAAYLESETGIRQTALLAPIFMKNAAAFKEFGNASKEVAGYAGQASAVMEDIPAVKLSIALNSLKESFTTLSTPIVVGLNAILTVFNKMPSFVKTTAISFGVLISAMYPIMLIGNHIKNILIFVRPLGIVISRLFSPIAGMFASLGGGTAIVVGLLSKIFLFTGALWGLYKIIQLLKIGWDAISLKFEKGGLDSMNSSARARLEEKQREGMIDQQGKLTSQGRWSQLAPSQNNSKNNTNETGVMVNGDVHMHIGSDKLQNGQKNSLAREMQAQLRAGGK